MCDLTLTHTAVQPPGDEAHAAASQPDHVMEPDAAARWSGAGGVWRRPSGQKEQRAENK